MRKDTINTCFLLMLITASVHSCKCNQDNPDIPLRVEGITQDSLTYKKDEIIVAFKQSPTLQEINILKNAFYSNGITDSIKIRRCGSCESEVQLWHADSIHSFISTEGVTGGSTTKPKGVGEDSIARYSLNYINTIPVDVPIIRRVFDSGYKQTSFSGAGKDTVIIAVLDTGVDTTQFINPLFVWKNKSNGGSCYTNDKAGWNFVDSNANITDNNLGIHGTLVSQYIINEFRNSATNFVQIMALKTHDANGVGDLFGITCAIHYAMAKGAKIINASWGFYNYHDNPLPYLDSLITKVLPQKGVLFFAAAGNKIPQDDSLAKEIYKQQHGGTEITDSTWLRNLEFHNFYPANLSSEQNNVITVTTTNELTVSPTQNYSGKYADLGVKADSVRPDHMLFRQPFVNGPDKYISGSSFATPIAAGKIGSAFNGSLYQAGIKKSNVFGTSTVASIIIISNNLKNKNRIRQGRYSKHSP